MSVGVRLIGVGGLVLAFRMPAGARHFVSFVAFLFALTSTVSQAAERYVGTAGNNANTGTIDLPWRTMQYAADHVAAGDTIYLRGGLFTERVTISVSGAPGAPITFRNFPGEAAIVDQNGVTPPNGDSALLSISGRSHLVVSGIVFQNYRTAADTKTPHGILLTGACQDVQILGCTIHHIEQNNPVLNNFSANAHGLLISGNSATPMSNIVVDGCEIHTLRLGASEALTVNGNVSGFAVTNNLVHDCNNIGIDCAGFEGTSPDPAQDRARNGVVAGNTVQRIDSSTNPAYGGNFTTGGGARSAAGIYVDGGTLITIERNAVEHCNFGIEVASEMAAGRADFITVRDNLLHHNDAAGLILGGYDHLRGETRDCVFLNNTLYENDTLTGGGGQIALQFYVSRCTFKNNVVWARAETRQFIAHSTVFDVAASPAQQEIGTGNIFDHQLYFASAGSATNLEFTLFQGGIFHTYTALTAWASAVAGESQSTFVNPAFATPLPPDTALPSAFKLTAASPAVNTGEPSPPFVPRVGEKDFFGQTRVVGGRVDRGAHEYLTPAEQWLDLYFGTPNATGSAAWNADPDGDGASNLVEYSQGMIPTRADAASLPFASPNGSNVRFTYRKAASELGYVVQTSGDLQVWSTSTALEQTDGAGLFWRDLPVTPGRLFVRLQVTLP